MRPKRIDRTCERCGAAFSVAPSALKRPGSGRYCSPGCRDAARKGRPIAERITFACETCGVVVTMPRSEYDWRSQRQASPPRFCSMSCRSKSPEFQERFSALYGTPEAARHIVAAGKSEEGRAARSERLRAKMQDPEWRAKWEASIAKRSDDPNWRNAPHFQAGADHPRYTGGRAKRRAGMARYEYKAWRTAVFQRDGYTCQECGQHGGALVSHHVQPWADNPALRYDVANGVTLCEACHDAAHGWQRRPKTYKCVDCGQPKPDGRCERCRSCGQKRRFSEARQV